ncbi:CsxC family protein [Evansella halocellulosilytica]|uniref:CsxC family protein n=1 Tax=Evansella halocellulosilytica TaxID=2011013 RepID=UPI000BB73595|nr:DUF3794 domain-containing protein [Evansella halocellulosilytica]
MWNRNHKPAPPYFKNNHRPKAQKNAVSPSAKTSPAKPDITKGHTIIKSPVVLAETTVQIDLNTTIKFPEPVLEIKDIKKNLKLTQCRLLLPTKKLFLSGFVRKNIQYASPKYGSPHSVISNIRSITKDVPFSAVAEVDFIKEPKFSVQPDRNEFTFFTTSPLPKGFAQKEELMSGDLSQFDQISGENFNELPFCELVSSRFFEMDSALDRKMGKVSNHRGECIQAPFEEGTFTSVEEKMVLELTLKVLQNQQVRVDSK